MERKAMRILIADDNEMVRCGVRGLLSCDAALEVCGEATNGTEALRTARELLPDLILLDISMPGKDGLETTHLLRQALPKTKILIMSQHDPVQFSPSALKAGAHAYVDKSRLGTDLLPAIESVARTSAAELASPDPSPSSRTPSSPAARPQEKRNEESALPFAVAFKIDFSPNLKSEI
jgi:DNA-binding NarL/FixJ family response regulator